MDLDDLEHNTRDGLHIASLAGAWIGAVAGFGGMRDYDRVLSFKPQLPQALTRIAFRVRVRGRGLLVEISHEQTRYTLSEGEQLEIVHHGEPATVAVGRALTRANPPAPTREAPTQPAGRAPARRRPPVEST
jgi:alpha,alpha-trehalose phosphorylase